MSDKLTELVSAVMAELKQVAKTETVIGEPVKLGDKMVVPVTRLMLGFGVGGGEGESPDKGGGFGGGGGGGARVEPIGFIVIQDDKVSFLPTKQGHFEGLIDAVPGIVEKVKDFIPGGKGKAKTKDSKKSEGEED